MRAPYLLSLILCAACAAPASPKPLIAQDPVPAAIKPWSDARAAYTDQLVKLRQSVETCVYQRCYASSPELIPDVVKQADHAATLANTENLHDAAATLHKARVLLTSRLPSSEPPKPLAFASHTPRDMTSQEAQRLCMARLCDHIHHEGIKRARAAFREAELHRLRGEQALAATGHAQARALYLSLANEEPRARFGRYILATVAHQKAMDTSNMMAKIIGPMTCTPQEATRCRQAHELYAKADRLHERARALYIDARWSESTTLSDQATELHHKALRTLPR